MSFTVLDHYKGFVSNSFIKKDITQIDLLKKISFAWEQFNKNNLFFSKKKKKVVKKQKNEEYKSPFCKI